jgi:hypothetical protein
MDDMKPETEDEKALREFEEAIKGGAAIETRALNVSGGNGGSMLYDMVPLFELVASKCESDERRKTWWRSFCIAAHMIALEHVGHEEGLESLRGVAEAMKDHYEASKRPVN